MGIRVKVSYPNPSPNSPGNSNEMQTSGLDEFIKNNFIPVLLNWNNYLTAIFFLFFFALFFLFGFARSCFRLFPQVVLWSIFPSDPAPWKGRVDSSASRAPELFSGAPPQWTPPFWGPLVLEQISPEEKRHSPKQGATNHARVDQVSFRMTASSIRSSGQSSFPFLERTSTGSPSECERFPPTGETHGALAGQDSVPRGGSQGRAWSVSEARDRTGGYRFRHHNSCGTKE